MTESLNTEERKEHCPYCGEPIHLIIEPMDEPQQYTEDCEVCCRPMIVDISAEGAVEVFREDDT